MASPNLGGQTIVLHLEMALGEMLVLEVAGTDKAADAVSVSTQLSGDTTFYVPFGIEAEDVLAVA